MFLFFNILKTYKYYSQLLKLLLAQSFRQNIVTSDNLLVSKDPEMKY